MKKHDYFMVSPDEFGVSYSINPWMNENEGTVDREIAWQQWHNLKTIIEKHANVHILAQPKNMPDLVFSANSGIPKNGKVVLANFEYAERQMETEINNGFFMNHYTKKNILFLPENIAQEGAGDALFDRNPREKPLLWAGIGFRSNPEAYPYIQDFLDIDIEILKLVSPEYYHLDISFAPLDNGHILYAPQSFDDASVAKIEQQTPKEKRIILSQKDLDNFNGNAVNIGSTVIVNWASMQLAKDLKEKGYNVVNNDISEFKKAGGGNKCLTIRME